MAVPRLAFASSLLIFSLLTIACAASYGNGMNPEAEKPMPIAIQGTILCKSGQQSYPIPGAKARITCVKTTVYGKEIAPVSVISGPADEKGYFLATLYPSQVPGRKITKCRAFLYYSPLADCHFKTDVNKGVRGAPLTSYRILHDKHLVLYSVGPFFYTSQPTFY